MPNQIGHITVPDIVASGTFPIVADYPFGRSSHPDVAIHQFGSGNAKIEQRFLLGAGAKRFTVRRAFLRDADRRALRDFWELKYGPYGAFTYNAPNDDGNGTTAYTCRFANEPLSWEMLADHACSLGVTLIEIPASNPTYALASTVTRFPPQALKDALLSQVQQMIPIIRIQPLQSGYPAVYLSDRRCTVGAQLYLPRLVDFDGISQSMGNEADDATFTFGNADRVMRDLANDVDLFRATIEFSLYHVGQQIKLDLWKGDIINWQFDSGAEFKVTAADGLYELNLPYPTRKVSRSCWKAFNVGACPYSTAGALDLVHFPSTDASKCDKGYDTANGCLAHGMKRYYGAVIAEPQGVTIKDNSTGVFGYGRSSITSVSLVSDSIYDQVIPEIYTDSEMPVNCKVAAGRDESDFYEALGIVGEGPLISYTAAHYEDLNGNPVAMGSTGAVFVGSTLDGQAQHGWPNQPTYGIRQVLGADPAAAGDWFSLDQAGNTTGGDWRKVFSGNSTYKDNYAAGTAFLVIRRSDTKGLQLTKPGDHAMVAYVQMGMSGWVWTSPGVRVFGPPLVNPVWIAINMLLRARGLRLGANASTAQLNLAETVFDVQAAIDAAAICDQQVTALVGAGSEAQFKFRGTLQEEKPLRDWLQEVLMNCLGYYTFSFGKLKVGVRVNSSTFEAFTIGNIVFNSLQLAPLKPAFNHLTANFADQDYKFVNNSVTVYDIDRATLLGGAAGPLFLKSNVNLSGTCTKSQAARIISIRLREELGGTSIVEWKAARQLVFRTTVLALNTEPGMICSMTHPDMPGGLGEFRVSSWKLNKDYSIDIQGRTTTDSMYDLIAGPKPADVAATPVPDENLQDTGVPGVVLCTPTLTDYGTYVADNIVVQPDASGNTNVVGATEITLGLYYVDELAIDLWASIDNAMDAATDPVTVNCTVNPTTTRVFRVGDFVVFNDEAADPNHAGRRSYECAQIVGPGSTGEVVHTGGFQFQRAYPGVDPGYATFGTLICSHLASTKFYKLDSKTFTYAVKKGFFRTPGLLPRVEAKIASVCVVAALVGVANHFGYGPFTVFPQSHHNEPFMPGDRTCSGGAYTFQIPGSLAAQDNVAIPLKVQNAASIRCVYAYLQQGTSDGQSAYVVKYSTDGGTTWNVLEKMGIAQNIGTPFKNTWDFLVAEGYGKPETRRLPYDDYGLITIAPITGSGAAQAVATASYDASTSGLVPGDFVFLEFGLANEEHVNVISVNTVTEGARKWIRDLAGQFQAAGIKASFAFSMECYLPPAAMRAKYLSYTGGVVAPGADVDLGVPSHQMHFGTRVRTYLRQMYKECADQIEAAGLPVVLQFGETQWWYFDNQAQDAHGGMPYYDQETISDFAAAKGHQIWPFRANTDDPKGDPTHQNETADFLRDRIWAYCQDVITYVRSYHPTAVFECLWPLDANQGAPKPSAKFRALNFYVNLPNQWKNSSYGIKYFRCEGFDYDVWQKNSGLMKQAITFASTALGRPASECMYLGGLYGSPDPPMAQAYGMWLPLKLYSFCYWAFDQFCLNSRPVPLEIAGQMQVIGAQYFKPNATRAIESVIAEPAGIVAGGALNRFEANRRKLNV